MADLIGQRVSIYRGREAGVVGIVVDQNVALDGTPMVLVQYGTRGIRLHVRAADVRVEANK